MSAVILNEVRRGFYLDSVALMRLSRGIADVASVQEAALMMGTPANKQIMREAGLLADPGETAQGNDLIIGIRAENDDVARAALAEALRQLDQPRTSIAAVDAWRPRSLRAAVKAMPDANLALISVPGDFAAAEARKALRRGLHVMIFSDNIPLEDELSLKREAQELGCLVMGPDCGTAIINGIPLAFANRVPRGEIGIIGASGTGMQEVSSLIAQAGKGVSQAIGVGGRDLKKEIGGITTLMALDALDADPQTSRIVLISKPPHPEVARKISQRIAESRKAFVVCLIGAEGLKLPENARVARTLKEAAELALDGAGIGADFAPDAVAARLAMKPSPAKRIAGLYSGGTLCAEAQLILAAAGRSISSNAPVPGAASLSEGAALDRVIDLGADEYTRGRPHPMIDPSVRDDALRAMLRDPSIGVVLLDVVIGYGAHADPAGHLAVVLAERSETGPVVVGSVTGTEHDPQIRSKQVAILQEAGVIVAPSNAQAAELALALSRSAG